MQIMTRENNNSMNALHPRHFNLKYGSVIFPQLLNDIVLYAQHFLSSFFLSITFINYVSSYRKM